MAPLFTEDDLFDTLVSYARAAARNRGLTTLDRTSFDLGVAYALVSGKVVAPAGDLQLPDESALNAYAQANGCSLAELVPTRESMRLEEVFRTDFVAKHLKHRSDLTSLLKDMLGDLSLTLQSMQAFTAENSTSGAEFPPVYYSIVIAANREDFGIFLPVPTLDFNLSTEERSVLNREKVFKCETQTYNLKTLVENPGKANSISVDAKEKRISEIDFGNPLGIPLVPDGLHLTPLPESIVLERSELRLYVCSSPQDKAVRISRLPHNSDVWQLAMPPGATLKNSAPIIRAAAARLFLLATVGRKKIEISNLLQVKHKHHAPSTGAGAGGGAGVKSLAFPFDTADHVLGAYFAFCLAIVALCMTVHPAISLLGFATLAWTISRDIFGTRNQLIHMASRLGSFWGPQLGLTIFGLALGIWPVTAELLHVDFLSATLYGSIPLIFSFSLVALDFQPQNEREAIKKHEEIHHALATHMHEITQTTLSVALGNLVRSSKPHAYSYFPEMLITQMDKEIGTLEAVDAFRRLINDRIKTTEATVKQTHEGQQHARRTVMAAGGAVFTGFFAFEAGEKIIEYQHLQAKCDIVSFYHWNWNKYKSGVASEAGHALPSAADPTHGTTATTQTTPKHACSSYEDFHQHELSSTGMLLLATLAISLLTAIVAIRKPSDEQGGGMEHH